MKIMKIKLNTLSDANSLVKTIDKYDYDKCFLFCELDKEKKEFKEIINVFSNTSIKELNIVMFK